MSICETCVYSADATLHSEGRYCAIWGGIVNDGTREETINCSDYAERGEIVRKCDCGAEPYYSYEDATRGGEEDITLCESCYVGELEAIAMQYKDLEKKLRESQEQAYQHYRGFQRVEYWRDRYRKALENVSTDLKALHAKMRNTAHSIELGSICRYITEALKGGDK